MRLNDTEICIESKPSISKNGGIYQTNNLQHDTYAKTSSDSRTPTSQHNTAS